MLVVDLVISCHCLVKKGSFWQKSSKSTVSYKNWFHFFILLSHSFTETDSKKGQVLWQVF